MQPAGPTLAHHAAILQTAEVLLLKVLSKVSGTAAPAGNYICSSQLQEHLPSEAQL